MLTKIDLDQIRKKGISKKDIEKQLETFRIGFPYAHLKAAATAGDGIDIFRNKLLDDLESFYHREHEKYKVIKFVPASGAATRMFKHLFEFRTHFDKNVPDSELFADRGFNSPYHFFHNLHKFAFIKDLDKAMSKNGYRLQASLENRDYDLIIDFLLESVGLNYGQLPKGLIKFHDYGTFSRTAFGEHLVEGVHYCKDKDRSVSIHFTISPEHLGRFRELLDMVRPYYESMYGVNLDVGFSIQKASTDTVAVDKNNKPVRQDGELVFRPGGHGALIENLNDLNADIVFIKNIDNIIPDRLKADTYKYKKVIAGLLIRLQQKIFEYLRHLSSGQYDELLLGEITAFCHDQLHLKMKETSAFLPLKDRAHRLFNLLNRPIRVCGMVKNEGEPGGGPFWVKSKGGRVSLQIVETSQINTTDPDQHKILQEATHFNPVDLVCGIRDFEGKKFDLRQFVDPDTGFISIKSKDGKQLKALELPGLWNGAMAHWNTLFVEVPITTFNPVKTVNDLLREQHQQH